MHIYVSADMEGVSGVTRAPDVTATGQDYQAARTWFTGDVNAAIRGARAAGATTFTVEENHGAELLCNLDLDLIDAGADVIRGFPRGGSTTIAGLDSSCDAVFLIGHHSRVGGRGILAHTTSGFVDVRVNGRTVGEGELIAMAAAELDIPTILVTGDDAVAEELTGTVPGIATATVKSALSSEGARLQPPARAQQTIEQAARAAVEALLGGHRPVPALQPPYTLEIELSASYQRLLAGQPLPPELSLDGSALVGTVATAREAWDATVAVAAAVLTAFHGQQGQQT